MNNLFNWFKNKSSPLLKKAKIIANKVDEKKDEYRNLDDDDIKKRVEFLSNQLVNNKINLDDMIVDGLAIAREIIYRVHNIFAFPVQIMGAYIVHTGNFCEMFTGEGKTVTIMLISFVNALSRKGVHIVTVNEYLVKRDAIYSNEAFEKYGVTVGYNLSSMQPNTKREMYSKDIIYTTNSELGFDYLRDNMVNKYEDKVIRNLWFAILDEGDSILIDEARVPLIISGMPKEDENLYLEADSFVKKLKENDYVIDAESNSISLSESGVEKAQKEFNIENIFSIESSDLVHKITNALMANYIFQNGCEYIVKDDKIMLVDIFTGRILEGRSYNAGLQQAIQAKERIKIEPENQILATITYQSFFRLYSKLAALSGTAKTEHEEFLKIYNMIVVPIPTNKPVVRIDWPDYIFGNKQAKWNHVVAEIERKHQIGQPILVGTSSINDSEILHRMLKQKNIPHEILNAKNDEREAEIISRGGAKGSITISTNMAGRGTDIKIDEESRKLGGLYVIGTERHESRRVDNQLRGRSGRQGDPGESRFFTSLEDTLFKRFATDRFQKASEKLSNDDYFDSKFFSKFLDRTQKKVEGLNFDIRKNLMDYDHVVSLQRELIYKQRDQILRLENNLSMILNMAKEAAIDIVNLCISEENSAIVDAFRLCAIINSKFFKFSFFKSNNFYNMQLKEAQSIVTKIIQTYISEKYKLFEKSNLTDVINRILLQSLDTSWVSHLDKVSKLKDIVNLRAYEQKTPLYLYIEEGNNYFELMKKNVIHKFLNAFNNYKLPDQEIIFQEKFNKEFSSVMI